MMKFRFFNINFAVVQFNFENVNDPMKLIVHESFVIIFICSNSINLRSVTMNLISIYLQASITIC